MEINQHTPIGIDTTYEKAYPSDHPCFDQFKSQEYSSIMDDMVESLNSLNEYTQVGLSEDELSHYGLNPVQIPGELA